MKFRVFGDVLCVVKLKWADVSEVRTTSIIMALMTVGRYIPEDSKLRFSLSLIE
jgi:hypothetical protein